MSPIFFVCLPLVVDFAKFMKVVVLLFFTLIFLAWFVIYIKFFFFIFPRAQNEQRKLHGKSKIKYDAFCYNFSFSVATVESFRYCMYDMILPRSKIIFFNDYYDG